MLFLGCALLLRLVGYALSGGILHSDEIFQYAEQAHRLVFGQGLVPWEYRAGIRSWLFPGMLAGVMESARLVGSGPVVQNAAIALFMSLLSWPSVACCYLWGRKAAGAAGGVAAGVLAAAWPEAVLIGIHPLLDCVGADCLVPAVFLTQRTVGEGRKPGKAWAGLLLGLTVVFRLQLAPCAAWCWLRLCVARPRQDAMPVLLWACVPLLFSGVLDWLTLGSPFQSFIRYYGYNSRGAADFFGSSPWYYYPSVLTEITGFLSPFMALCICFGVRRLPLLAELACVILLTFSIVPHKEFRFILPAFPFLLTLAGAGSAQLAGSCWHWLGLRKTGWLVPVLAAAWIFLCAAHVRSQGSANLWVRGTATVAEMHRAAADPASCAVAMVPSRVPTPWFVVGGYTHLRPGMDLVVFNPGTAPGRVIGFDYAIAPKQISLSTWGLDLIECRLAAADATGAASLCLWHNAGGCRGPRLPEMKLSDPPIFKQDGLGSRPGHG